MKCSTVWKGNSKSPPTIEIPQVDGWDCHPTVKNSDSELFCLKELQGQKWRRDQGKDGPVTGPTWDPAQGEAPSPEIITGCYGMLIDRSLHGHSFRGPTSS